MGIRSCGGHRLSQALLGCMRHELHRTDCEAARRPRLAPMPDAQLRLDLVVMYLNHVRGGTVRRCAKANQPAHPCNSAVILALRARAHLPSSHARSCICPVKGCIVIRTAAARSRSAALDVSVRCIQYTARTFRLACALDMARHTVGAARAIGVAILSQGSSVAEGEPLRLRAADRVVGC